MKRCEDYVRLLERIKRFDKMKLQPESLQVLENVRTAPGHYRMRLASPRIARLAQPGQFVQITVSEHQDPLLPRPFSFLEVGPGWFDILYQVVGRGTEILSKKKKNDNLTVLGPLGCGWRLPSFVGSENSNGLKNSKAVAGKNGQSALHATTFVLVGGGVGIPPIYHWAKELLQKKKIPARQIRVFLGGRGKDFLHNEKEFTRLGAKPSVATDDGSRGHKGFVTTPLEEFLKSAERAVAGSEGAKIQIYTCGPTPMLRAVSAIAARYAVPCQVSVEEPMPCGFGVCLGCAIKVSDGCGGHRFALSCTEGPVFDAAGVLWS